MRKVSNMLVPNYFRRVKKLLKIERIEIFSVFICILSEKIGLSGAKKYRKIVYAGLRLEVTRGN